MSWRVKQIDTEPVVVKLKHRRTDRDASLLFQLHPVARSCALGLSRRDRAGQVQSTAIQQQFLSQRRLAGVWMRDDRKGSSW